MRLDVVVRRVQRLPYTVQIGMLSSDQPGCLVARWDLSDRKCRIEDNHRKHSNSEGLVHLRTPNTTADYLTSCRIQAPDGLILFNNSITRRYSRTGTSAQVA